MLNCLKESFRLTNKYIILATPLILFSLLSSLYILFSIGGNKLSLLIAFVLFTLMLGAFLSGWFFMIREGVKDPDMEDPNFLIKDFPAGVGEYFLPVLGLIAVVFIIASVIVLLAYFAGMKLIGEIEIPAEVLSKAMESFAELKSMLLSLTEEQLFRLNAWNLLLFAAMTLTYFVIMFYAPAMFFKEKNPLKAYFVSLKDLFSRKFLQNIMLFFSIFVSYFILSILTTIFGMNIVMHFVFTIINFYYLVFMAVWVFNHYYINYARIGSQIDKLC